MRVGFRGAGFFMTGLVGGSYERERDVVLQEPELHDRKEVAPQVHHHGGCGEPRLRVAAIMPLLESEQVERLSSILSGLSVS